MASHRHSSNSHKQFQGEKVVFRHKYHVWVPYSFHSRMPVFIFLFYPSQIINYIITGWVNNFLMHLVRGWHFLCKNEIIKRFILNIVWVSIKKTCYRKDMTIDFGSKFWPKWGFFLQERYAALSNLTLHSNTNGK